jgi:hypothetical protein
MRNRQPSTFKSMAEITSSIELTMNDLLRTVLNTSDGYFVLIISAVLVISAGVYLSGILLVLQIVRSRSRYWRHDCAGEVIGDVRTWNEVP